MENSLYLTEQFGKTLTSNLLNNVAFFAYF